MKRKIGELRNIPIVEGDKNLVREGTEIHINDLQSKGGSSGGSGGILYLKYNGERYYMYVINNPMSKGFPIIAGVAIFNSEGGSNDIRSYTYSDIYMKRPVIDGFGDMAIPKMNNLKFRTGDIEFELNTTSKENIILSYAKALANLQNIDINETISQVKEMFKDWEECSEEEFYEIFNQYR